MPPIKDSAPANDWSSVDLAFSKQAVHFDLDDLANPVLQSWRKQIYAHVQDFLRPGSRILELNAGTGIDALHFANQGHSVLATDLSTGMVREIEHKIAKNPKAAITCRQLSFDQLDRLSPDRFDFVFSNFGGLNCIRELSLVTLHLPRLLNPGAVVTWVIMPRFCPWELLWLFKGKWRDAFRRFRRDGAPARLEGATFRTYYHSLSEIRRSFGDGFTFIKSEGLGVFSAPPAATDFQRNHPLLHRSLMRLDGYFNSVFPFNRWGDHIIVSFRKNQ